MDDIRERRGPRFDWTINLGHILTFIGFIGAGATLYTTLDKRLQRMEDMAPYVQSSRDEKDRLAQAAVTSLAADVKDVRLAVDRLNLKLEVQNAMNERATKK